MAPRFRKKDDSVEAGFRRIALAEIEKAIAIIDERGRPDADKVHQVRRQLKALRALLRLVRPAFDRFHKENVHLRDMARTLSHTRDARVMLDTFDAITGADKGRPLPRGFLVLRERLDAAFASHADVHALLERVRAGLVKARGRAARWDLSADGWDALASGLAQTYGHARQTMRETLASGDAEASHEWRKGVKYHAAHARLLGRMRPGELSRRAREATRLGDLLGQRHDIDMLLETLARAPARFGDVITVTQIAGLARLRLARLDRRARPIGEALFEEKPEKLARQWARRWHDWKGDHA